MIWSVSLCECVSVGANVSMSGCLSVLACAWVCVCVCVPVPKGWCNFITHGVVSFHFVLPVMGPPHLFFSSIPMMAPRVRVGRLWKAERS